MPYRYPHAVGVLKGLRKVAAASVKSQTDGVCQWWNYSSLKSLVDIELSFVGKSGSQRDWFKSAAFIADRINLFVRQGAIVCRHLLSSSSNTDYIASTAHNPTPPAPMVTPDHKIPHFYASKYDLPTETSELHPPVGSKAGIPNSTSPNRDSIARTTEVVDKPQRTLTAAKERRVPSSRIGRIAGFGNLAVGLGLGAAAEWTKRKVGFSGSGNAILGPENPFLTEANLQRIVDTLCRMRGAALKLGQMLSIQDESLVSPQVQKIFERVRQAADFMPARQMRKVLAAEFGPDWSEHLIEFEEKPFAAASIGQVHRAKLHDGRTVAMKIQYPGVADSIDADINNLMTVLNRFNVLPRGLFADRAIEVAKRELRAECDYLREAQYCKHFASLLAGDSVFQVPAVIDELTSSRVLTAEFMEGMVLDDCILLPQNVRNWLGEQLLRLCLKELFVFHVMQTDPNWSNFLYNPQTGKIVLLDFGASRLYSKHFINEYIRLIHAASEQDREGILKYSHNLGFLTGYETKIMVDAHVDAVSILGEAFASNTPFDFGGQSTTRKINGLIPVMIEHRLTPPPDESYSLHRKMSGCFLLCGKLKSVVNCRPLFLQIWNEYDFESAPSHPDSLN